eukprot:SAG11_NODE_664_length_7866_cov_6.323291_4_plen_36_part_00
MPPNIVVRVTVLNPVSLLSSERHAYKDSEIGFLVY